MMATSRLFLCTKEKFPLNMPLRDGALWLTVQSDGHASLRNAGLALVDISLVVF